MSLKPWIRASRPRTLPLAVSNVILGSMLAYGDGNFDAIIFSLGLLTALLLQVLSNYANDYGDSMNKADDNRVSKYERALTTGAITPKQMRIMLAVLSTLIFFTGMMLVITGLKGMSRGLIIAFIGTGILCIIAAITYTVGRKPYGYMGLGDISVFIFFGWVAICGIYMLHTRSWNLLILLPASAFGLLSVGVLNINNIRDVESDRAAGKETLVVRMGVQRAKIYHIIVITLAIILSVIYTFANYKTAWQWLFLLSIPLFIRNIQKVWAGRDAAVFDDELRNLSLTSFLFVLTFGSGLLFYS